MNKIRLIFLIAVFVVSVFFLLKFNTFQSPSNPEIEKISQFKITKISGNGRIYFSKRPIAGNESAADADTVDIKRTQYKEEMYIRSDSHTAFEFYCFGTSFTILPDSYLYYHPKTKEIYFYNGEFYWKKEITGKRVDISIREPGNILALSGSGRVRIKEDLVEIWNYSGNLKLNYGGEDYNLRANKLFTWTKRKNIELFDILPLPESIDPEKMEITLIDPDDSVVKFNWKVVKGAPQYIFRLYSSNLKENILLENFTEVNRINLDLLQFEEREFYWQVFPFDPSIQQEGTPSITGHIKMSGALLKKKNVAKPPELNIKSLTVNGNLVIIKGDADTNSQLYINDEEIKVDMDGGFIHTLSFKTIGPKKILFRLVSPLGVETIEERMVTIYAE